MLIHPWDAALDPSEWQNWLASTDRFGMLAVNNLDPAESACRTAHPLHGRRRRRAAYAPGPAEPGLAPPGGGRRGTAGCGRRLRLHPYLLAGQGRRPR